MPGRGLAAGVVGGSVDGLPEEEKEEGGGA